jgi:hypothetical protein
VTPSVSRTPSASVTPSISVTPAVTPSATPAVTPTRTPSISVTPASTPPGTPPVTPTRTPSISVTPASTPPSTPPVTPTRTPSSTAPVTPTPTPTATLPPQGFAIDVYGRGASTSAACNPSGVPTVYVALEQYQTDYNAGGFNAILGVTLYENIYLSSTVADAYASDTYAFNVHSLSAGTVGSFIFGC